MQLSSREEPVLSHIPCGRCAELYWAEDRWPGRKGRSPPSLIYAFIGSISHHPAQSWLMEETHINSYYYRILFFSFGFFLLVTFYLQYTSKLNPCLYFLTQGGEIGINIEWKCNLDWSVEFCVPRYSFTRLDAPFAKNAVSKGYNFRYGPSPLHLWASLTKAAPCFVAFLCRFAKYFKTENGTEYRRLHKAFAIRFDVMVTGNVSLIMLIVSKAPLKKGTLLTELVHKPFFFSHHFFASTRQESLTPSQRWSI